jgi:hypothetical protein
VGLASKDKIMSRRPTHFQLLSHRFARPQDLLVILLAGPERFFWVLGSEEGLERSELD